MSKRSASPEFSVVIESKRRKTQHKDSDTNAPTLANLWTLRSECESAVGEEERTSKLQALSASCEALLSTRDSTKAESLDKKSHWSQVYSLHGWALYHQPAALDVKERKEYDRKLALPEEEAGPEIFEGVGFGKAVDLMNASCDSYLTAYMLDRFGDRILPCIEMALVCLHLHVLDNYADYYNQLRMMRHSSGGVMSMTCTITELPNHKDFNAMALPDLFQHLFITAMARMQPSSLFSKTISLQDREAANQDRETERREAKSTEEAVLLDRVCPLIISIADIVRLDKPYRGIESKILPAVPSVDAFLNRYSDTIGSLDPVWKIRTAWGDLLALRSGVLKREADYYAAGRHDAHLRDVQKKESERAKELKKRRQKQAKRNNEETKRLAEENNQRRLNGQPPAVKQKRPNAERKAESKAAAAEESEFKKKNEEILEMALRIPDKARSEIKYCQYKAIVLYEAALESDLCNTKTEIRLKLQETYMALAELTDHQVDKADLLLEAEKVMPEKKKDVEI